MANTYKALQTVSVGAGGASSISFTNIPATYTDLKLVLSARAATTGANWALIGINGGSDTAIALTQLFNNSGSVISQAYSSFRIPMNQSTFTANSFSNAEVYFPNYVLGNNKSMAGTGTQENNSSTTGQQIAGYIWNVTNPITSLTLTVDGGGNFAQYSTATLYGVFNADVSTAPATPTIGTATAGNESASITFTGVSNAASYTMTSTPGSITGTGTTSPITVSGLTGGTSYTFKVKSNNPFGSSAESAASNSVTPFSTAFDSIATATPNGASSITFSSIPSTYKHLQIRFTMRGNAASGPRDIRVQFNSNTGAVYRWHTARGSGSSFTSSNGDGVDLPNYLYFGMGPTAADSSNIWAAGVIDILDYASTTKNKTLQGLQGYDANSGTGYCFLLDGHFASTSAISSILIELQSGSFVGGTSFALYGIKG